MAISTFAIAFLTLAAMTATARSQTQMNSERRIALQAVQSQLETLKNTTFEAIFAMFDDSTHNDGPVAPGANFDVVGLTPIDSDPDGQCGLITLPTRLPPLDGEGNQPPPYLWEGYVDTRLGMPADLDGDGVVDDDPKDDGYLHLPVRVEVRWNGAVGDQRLHVATWLTPRR